MAVGRRCGSLGCGGGVSMENEELGRDWGCGGLKSGFHLLEEFDEAKRSCRKRLDERNRRRRTPQVVSKDSWSFMTTQQGLYSNGETSLASFSAPRAEPSWSGIIKYDDSNPYYTHEVLSKSRQNFTGSTSSDTMEGWHFPFLHEGDPMSFSAGAAALEIPVCQPLLMAVTPPPPESSSSIVLSSDCVLSILSSPANSSSMDITQMVRPSEQIPSVAQQCLVPDQQFSSSSWFACSQASSGVCTAAGFAALPSMDIEQLNTGAQVLSWNDNEMNCHGIFHVGADGYSEGTSPYFQFSWQ
uniref:Squamosa promoter-binding-like protein 18 n=1 Tax=Aegilops tauschii TaxID=37682 RepID=M8B454_AEGTA